MGQRKERRARASPLESRTRALLDFAWKLTQEQWACREADTQGLRQAGWSDEAIVDVVGVIGFFNFITRIADAVGVELNAEYGAAGKATYGAIAQ